MNSNLDTNQDGQVSEGVTFLHAVLKFSSQCERSTDEYLASKSAQDSISTHEHLGTLLSLLDRASSCWWGCRGGDHAAEQLVGRCCSYGMGAFKLARSGFYDESIALARTIGEITNLATLFLADTSAFQAWKVADEKTRRSLYSPVKVRLILEEKNLPVPINQHRYGQLSAKSVHLTPSILLQMYNINRHSKTGGYFQEIGLLLCLAEIAYPLSVLSLCAVGLCSLPGEHEERVIQAGNALSQSLSNIRNRVNASFPGTYS